MSVKTILFYFFIAALLSGNCYAEEKAGALTMAGGLKLATGQNRAVKIAAYDVTISSEDVRIARSRMLPSVDVSVAQTLLSNQPGAHFGTRNINTAERSSLAYGINARQTIYDFGANRSHYEVSRALLDTKNLSLALTKNVIALDFIAAYLDILETEKLLITAHKEVERLGSHLNKARIMFEEGVITRNDVLQSEVRLSDARQKQLTLKNSRALNASRINNILSRPLSSEVRVEDVTADAATHGLGTLDDAWARAEAMRMEPAVIDRELRAVELEETAKKSEYYPRFFAQGGYNYAENRFQLHQDNWSLLLGMNVNLFSGGSSGAEVSKARHIKEQMLEQKKKLIDDIKIEVEKYYLSVKNAEEKIVVTKDAVGQAEENLRINRVRYEEGIGTSTDVLDAISLLTTAETNYHRAVYDLRRAEAGLMFATGMDMVAAYK